MVTLEERGGRRLSKARPFAFLRAPKSKSIQFWILSLFFVLAFALGGSARGDVQSLLLLRPLSIIFCGIGLWTLRTEHVRRYGAMFVLALVFFLLIGLQLVPLPPSIWASLPGRELVWDLDHAVGLGEVWRPLSLYPAGTENALYSLFAPLAVLILGAQLDRREQRQLIPVLIFLGIVSLLLGLLQVVGASGSGLYFYAVTNSDASVGLFANRNHAAVFLACIPPLCAIYASSDIHSIQQGRFRLVLAAIVAVLIILAILISGSRTGTITTALGLVAVPFLYRKPFVMERAGKAKSKPRKISPTMLWGGVGIVALVALAALFSRADSLVRLFSFDSNRDIRSNTWGPVAEMAWKYFPAGSGVGTFSEVFELNEPTSLLKPSYFNHAHNDFLEMYMTGGIIGLLLTGAIILLWATATIRAWRSNGPNAGEAAVARMASAIFLIFALASSSDYPLRSPSLACFGVLAMIWLTTRGGPLSASKKL